MFPVRQIFVNAAKIIRNSPVVRFSNTAKLCNINAHQGTHRVSDMEKRFLVWTKKYASVGEVPTHVTQDVMERCRNKMRIRVANYMMALTALACIGMIISGKRAAARGESVHQMNLDWHSKIKEQEDSAAEKSA